MGCCKKNVPAAGLVIAALLVAGHAQAISLDDVPLWAGAGTNRAAFVIEWSVPESLANSTVPIPVADKTLVWGYRFNGTASGSQMLGAILAADPKLYVIETNASLVTGIGYNLNVNGLIAITDGSTTNFISHGVLTNAFVNIDAAYAINAGDLYWGGFAGPRWEVWTELSDSGGFLLSPNRGSAPYWTPTDTVNFTTGNHGQWSLAQTNMDHLQLANGSWIGFSMAAGERESAANAPYNAHKHAPVSPDGTYVAYVPNSNDFAVQVITSSNLDAFAPDNDPAALLGGPMLQFYDPFDGAVTDRVSIIDPAFNVTSNGTNGLVVIEPGGQITVNMGRKIYANTNDPYGVDLIVYGNTFFDNFSGAVGLVSDATDLSTVTFKNSANAGHQAIISVSQDGVNWFTYTNIPTLFPDQSYRWDDTNMIWTAEEMNANKPLNPYLSTNNFAGQTVAGVLDQFTGASGGTGYSLQPSGLPWIQYVRVQALTNANLRSVLDAIAAVNPATMGDALSIAPDNLAGGTANLYFQRPNNLGQNQIAIGFSSVNEPARITTVSLNDFSPFAPVEGTISDAYQIMARPLTATNAVTFTANVGLRTGDSYSGNGSDLHVFEWSGLNWIVQPFIYNPANNEVAIAGVTNFSAFVVSQIIPPALSIAKTTNSFAFQFAPVPNCPEILERSTDLITWTNLCTFTATNVQPIVLQDTNAPGSKAFYRIQVNP